MEYKLKRPCKMCPFRREGGARVRPARALSIIEAVTTNPGATFTCHETTASVEHEDGESDRADGPKAQHCVGALIFAKKQDVLAMPPFERIDQ